jgi:hypothetical protein
MRISDMDVKSSMDKVLEMIKEEIERIKKK